jgi:regulator of sigma E protease
MSIIEKIYWLGNNGFFIALGILGISFLIGFHELGHFLFCKLFGIRTPSFSIGFGPKLISRTLGSTNFSLSAIPFGGYVEIAGAAEVGQGEQKEAHAADSGSFAVKPFYQKLLVLLGGIIFNLMFAYAAFIALFTMGVSDSPHYFPLNTQPVIAQIVAESPAAHAGLLPDDIILRINNENINGSAIKALALIKGRPSDSIEVTVQRDNQEQTVQATIPSTQMLGVQFKASAIKALPFIDALKQGIQTTNFFIYQTMLGFKQLLTTWNVKQMAGPLAIISMTTKSASIGMSFFLYLLALISINLAVFNLIPLPILDGGQIAFYAIEAIIRRPLSAKIKEYIHIACWFGFIALTIYLSAHDIVRIVQSFFQK